MPGQDCPVAMLTFTAFAQPDTAAEGTSAYSYSVAGCQEVNAAGVQRGDAAHAGDNGYAVERWGGGWGGRGA